ncbi:hypothetical protein P5673_025990 [Acropora cervicornis]|uniref:Uncharacterized protein n=1 Tax=Acropora cervicornis TaxID=6130 RepID=A0AAD9Q142_ACRCE|nr:hypothetical protein P5673_025990 [Acropora cervicornis]
MINLIASLCSTRSGHRLSQNELLQIIADLIDERITMSEPVDDISRTEQVSLCLSFALNGTKKEAFVGFYLTKSTEGEVLYELVKSSITELILT